MKLSTPKTPEKYFEQTELAVRHFFAGIEIGRDLIRQANQHWGINNLSTLMTPELRERLEKSMALRTEYFRRQISEAAFAGGILQVAYTAIRLYSQNTIIPQSCIDFISPKTKLPIQFCIGKELHDIPIGLIVYAGRNQFAHWDEIDSSSTTEAVFRKLTIAFWSDMLNDLAFDLRNPTIPVYSGLILSTALRWLNYDRYLADMKAMFP